MSSAVIKIVSRPITSVLAGCTLTSTLPVELLEMIMVAPGPEPVEEETNVCVV